MPLNGENRTTKIRKIYCGSAIALVAMAIAFSPRVIQAVGGTCRTLGLLTSDFSDANGPYEPQQYLSIKLADVDGDRTDDLCYRSVGRTTDFLRIGGGIVCRTSSTGFALSGWSREFGSTWSWYERYWGTIRYPDLNGDGKADICGRGSAGIICALSTGTSFRMPGTSIFSTGATVWSSTFSDANGWGDDPSYWKTIQFPDLNDDGKADVCGRASDGIYCALSNGTSFLPTTRWTLEFSNAGGWHAHPGYWSTIRFADVTGDGRADVCGRGVAGVWCGESSGSAFTAPTSWTNQYSDIFGWDDERYYATLQLADVNGDGKADICGRGSAGVYCGRSTGTAFVDTANVAIPDFSDAGGWSEERFYKTIRLIDVNGDFKADVCGRGINGIFCATSGPLPWVRDPQTGIPVPDSTISFAAVRLVVAQFGDLDGWGASESYWATVQPHRKAVRSCYPCYSTHSVEWVGRGYDGIYKSQYDWVECPPNF